MRLRRVSDPTVASCSRKPGSRVWPGLCYVADKRAEAEKGAPGLWSEAFRQWVSNGLCSLALLTLDRCLEHTLRAWQGPEIEQIGLCLATANNPAD